MCGSSQTQTGHGSKSFDLRLYLLNVADQGVAVLVPVGLERVLVGELITAELQRDLKAVAAEVVEILHPCGRTIKRWDNVRGHFLKVTVCVRGRKSASGV